MQTSFRITPAELTVQWLENLKSLISSKEEIEITIKDFTDNGYPSISFEEACKKVSTASKEYVTSQTLFSPQEVLQQVIK